MDGRADATASSVDALKQAFCNGPSVGSVEAWMQTYEEESSPRFRDRLIAETWVLSLKEPFAWDALEELCRQMLKRRENPPPILAKWAMWATTRKGLRPGIGRGHPMGSFSEKLDIIRVVQRLTYICGFTKTAAYRMVSDWCTEPNARTPRSPDAIRKIVTRWPASKPLKGGHK